MVDKTILIVDDTVSNLDIVSDFLIGKKKNENDRKLEDGGGNIKLCYVEWYI